MDLDEIRKKESGIRASRIKQLSAKGFGAKKIDFGIEEGKIRLGNEEISAWVSFFAVASTTAFLLSYIAFGDSGASVCNTSVSPVLENLCVGWQPLFMLVFSILVLPITFLIGTVEFFRGIEQKTESSEKIGEQLHFQENLKMISKVLVYSLFILAVQSMIYLGAFDFLPEILKLPFVVFDTDAMLPIALALSYYTVRKREAFFSTSKRLLYVVIFFNIISVALSRGVQLVWEASVGGLF